MTKQQPNSRNRRTEKAPPHAQPERRRSGGGAAVREPACEPCNPSNKDRRSRQEQETTLTPAQEAEEERILLENEKTAQKLYIKSMADHVAAMINLLVTRKQLPSFYFHDAARAAGIPQKTFRNWKIREWPETPMRKHSRIQDIGQTLLLVMLRMSKYPHSETYWEAVARLQKRIRTLLATYSRNSLTQLMNVPNGTIDKILVMENKERGRYNHCPWGAAGEAERRRGQNSRTGGNGNGISVRQSRPARAPRSPRGAARAGPAAGGTAGSLHHPHTGELPQVPQPVAAPGVRGAPSATARCTATAAAPVAAPTWSERP